MKHLLTSLAVLMSCASAHAEFVFVIDAFSHGDTTLPASTSQLGFAVAGGTRDTVVGSNTQIQLGANSFNFQGSNNTATAQLTYNLSAPLNMTTTGLPNLMLNLFGSAQGIYNVVVSVNSSTSPGLFSFPTAIVSNPGTGALSFNGSIIPGATGLTVDFIQITLQQTSPANFSQFNQSSGAMISATPEPASLALLSMTGLGGWFMARRRAKKTQPLV